MRVRQIAESVYNKLAHVSGLEEREKVADLALPVDHTENKKAFGDYKLEDVIQTLKKNGATEEEITKAMAVKKGPDGTPYYPLDDTIDYRAHRE